MYPNTYDSASALVARGLQLASYDGWRVTPQDPAYWRDRPDEAVCLVTGPPSGIVVVALDSDLIVWTRSRQLREGVLARLDLPPTLMLRTSSGRRSVFYRVSG